jgi:hypothetical protein
MPVPTTISDPFFNPLPALEPDAGSPEFDIAILKNNHTTIQLLLLLRRDDLWEDLLWEDLLWEDLLWEDLLWEDLLRMNLREDLIPPRRWRIPRRFSSAAIP